MLQSIHLQGFKGFKDTQVGPFKMVNLILGGQNVGKTSLLEAIQVTVSNDLVFPFRPNEGNDFVRFVSSAFPENFGPIEIDTSFERNARLQNIKDQIPYGFRQVASRINCMWLKSTNWIDIGLVSIPLFLPSQDELVRSFSEISLSRKKRQLTELLREVEPRLESLDVALPDGEHRIYVELHGIDRALPLPQLGHGFGRLLYLYTSLLKANAQLALIDEVENGIHYAALPTLFKGIKLVAQDRGVQSLITTHSWDAIRAACEVFEDTPELFQVIRLERTGDNIQAVCIEGERMLRMMARDMEVR